MLLLLLLMMMIDFARRVRTVTVASAAGHIRAVHSNIKPSRHIMSVSSGSACMPHVPLGNGAAGKCRSSGTPATLINSSSSRFPSAKVLPDRCSPDPPLSVTLKHAFVNLSFIVALVTYRHSHTPLHDLLLSMQGTVDAVKSLRAVSADCINDENS